MIDDQVEFCFWDYVHERWEDLEGIFSVTEDYLIVTEEIVVVEDVSAVCCILEYF